MFAAIRAEAQQRKHECLKIRNRHGVIQIRLSSQF